MSDLNWEENDKIPFDSEPIERKPSMDYKREKKKRKENNSSKPKAFGYFLLALIFGVFTVLTYSFMNMKQELAKLKEERSNYTMNISSSGGNSSYATTKGMLSSVCVSASSTNNGGTSESFFSSAMASRGSGVIIDVNKETGDAYVITNFHVVASTGSLKPFNYTWVLLWDSVTPIPALYVGGSYTYDIAVLKITGSNEIKNSACASATIASSSKASVGEAVVAIGNSMARNLRISTGVVAVEEELMGSAPYGMYISHSADVNSGNSGGGLFNENGDLLGIVNAKFRDVNESTGELIYGEVIHGMNYAIPSEIALSVAENLIRNNGVLTKPNLKLSLGTNYTYNSKFYNIREDGFGYTSYKLVLTKAVGDFWVNDKLVSMEYKYQNKTVKIELNRLFSLESNIYNLSVGDKVKFVVERGGVEKEITVTISDATTVS